MKKGILLAVVAVFFIQTASADYVQGYTRQNGTYVQGYNRSSANGTACDNYSYQGNVNPYTGREGTSTQLDQNDYGYKPRPRRNSYSGYEQQQPAFQQQQFHRLSVW